MAVSNSTSKKYIFYTSIISIRILALRFSPIIRISYILIFQFSLNILDSGRPEYPINSIFANTRIGNSHSCEWIHNQFIKF